jgi:hypothetical protein
MPCVGTDSCLHQAIPASCAFDKLRGDADEAGTHAARHAVRRLTALATSHTMSTSTAATTA